MAKFALICLFLLALAGSVQLQNPEPPIEDICFQPLDSGNCYQKITHFYFDVERRKCHPFFYSGCGGNENNFSTMQGCKRTCEKQTDTPVDQIETGNGNSADHSKNRG